MIGNCGQLFFKNELLHDGFENSLSCVLCIGVVSYIKNTEYKTEFKNCGYPEKLLNHFRIKKAIDYINLKEIDRVKEKYRAFTEVLQEYINLDYDDLLMNFNLELEKKSNILKITILKDLILNNSSNVQVYQNTWKYIFSPLSFLPFNEEKQNLFYSIGLIESQNLNINVVSFLNYDLQNEMLRTLKIHSFADLHKVSSDLLYAIYCDKYFEVMSVVEELNQQMPLVVENSIKVMLDNAFKKDIYKDVYLKRNGINTEMQTLEEIAISYSLTRERIRQIEQKGEAIILNNIELKKRVCIMIENMLLEKSYIHVSDFDQYYINGEMKKHIISIVNIYDFKYRYHKRYNLICTEESLNELLNDRMESLGKIITKDTFDELSSLDKDIVLENYNLKKGNVYLKKGVNLAEVYCMIVDEKFPHGFSGTTYEMAVFNEELKKISDEFEITNKHVLFSMFERYDYCYIDRGKVVSRKYASKLDDELLLDILIYLDETIDIVYYTSIFEKFKDRLKANGINNRYYLKGVLDNELPENFTHQRDYISKGVTFKSSYEFIEETINNSKEIVTFEKLKEMFPAVQDYVFLNNISHRNDVVWIEYQKSFILMKNINITDELVDLLEKEIEALFVKLNSEFITSSKIYSIMMIKYRDKMEDIFYINSNFSFFSLLNIIFKDKYKFRRPYISKNDSILLANDALISNYIHQLERFNLEKINSYVAKMNMRGLYSYLEFLISESNDYVQINIDTAVKKELLFIDEFKLKSIEREINYYIDSFGPIDTRNYCDYCSLPEIRLSWNKYLFIGVIRTFLGDKYHIEYTDSMYNKTEFIVRR